MPNVMKLTPLVKDGGDGTREVIWVDVDTANTEDSDWLLQQSGLSERATSLLLQPGTVSRRENLGHSLFVRFCGITPREGVQQEEPFSLGLLLEPERVITTRSQPVEALEDVRRLLHAGAASSSPLAVLAMVAVSLTERLEGLITDLIEETDDLEDQVLAEDVEAPLDVLNALRRKVFRVTRHVARWQHLLDFIAADPALPAAAQEHGALRGATEHLAHYLESLEDCRGRTQLLHDQIQAQLAADMSRVSYRLTIVATVFLPLTFITGLLGINVAGIPDAHNPSGFWTVTIILLAVAIGAWVVLRWRKWV